MTKADKLSPTPRSTRPRAHARKGSGGLQPDRAELEALAQEVIAARHRLAPEDRAAVDAILSKHDPRVDPSSDEITAGLAIVAERKDEPATPTAKFYDGRIASPHNDDTLWGIRMRRVLGTGSHEFMATATIDLESITRHRSTEIGEDGLNQLNAALALISAIGPTDEMEASIAVQMAGTHALSVEMLGKARHTDDRAALESYAGLAIKLQRTYAAQIEALAKLRSAGKQVIEVQHVHVYPGGQAVVGTVNQGGGGGGAIKNSHQPHAAALESVFSPEVLSENALGDPMPLASDQREGAMQDARRQGERGSHG